MALFDFFKKKEIEEIKKLKNDIERIKDACQTEISNLNIQLVRYRAHAIIQKEEESKKNELPISNDPSKNKIPEKDLE